MSSAHSKLFVNEITKNKFVWLAILVCATLMVLVCVFPQMCLVLGLKVLSIKLWILSILASLIPLVLVQIYKIIENRSDKSHH